MAQLDESSAPSHVPSPQQYWPLGLPLVLLMQSFEQLLQSSPASQVPLLLHADGSHELVPSLHVSPPVQGSPLSLPELSDAPTLSAALDRAAGGDAGGDREQSLALARKGVDEARAANLELILGINGLLRARVLRVIGGPELEAELEAQIVDTYDLYAARGEFDGMLPQILLE